jgi:hypothetical protein
MTTSIRPGRTYVVRGTQGMNVAIPSSTLYVTVMEAPAPDGTTLVQFSMALRVRTEDLQER